MIRIEVTKSGLAAIGKNGFREAGRAAVRAACEHWWERILPLHFQDIAYLRYKYKSRSKQTNRLKAARAEWPFGDNLAPAVGEVKPLVWSGRSREAVTSSQNIKVKAPNYQRYEGRVVLNAPAFNFGTGKRIDMRDEVTRDTPQEVKTLERIFAQEWNKQLTAKGLRAPKRRTKIAA